jgi:hypothetical protein
MNMRPASLFITIGMIVLFNVHGLWADTLIKPFPNLQPTQPQITTTPKTAPTSPAPGMTVIQPQASFPELISVAPATLQQGQNATLNLTGRNLSKDMVLIMGPGITVGPIQQVGDKILLAPVSVTDTAAPGVRTISVQYKGVTRQGQARLTVTAVQAATVIQSITPNSIAQGESRELTISGKGLEFVRQMNFGPGVSAQLPKPGEGTLRVTVTAAKDAAPGQRAVSYSDRTGTHTSRLPFMVTINPQPEPPGKAVQPIQTKTPPAPVVMTISPNQWTQGGEYEVTVQGANLAQGLETRFGKGIEIKKLTVTSAASARMTVRVADQAPLGRQWLEIRPGPDAKWARSQALAEVQAKPAATVSVPPVKTPRPELMAITPNQWEQNGTYEITLQGAALPETLEARFGKDIVVQNFKITSPATATFTVQIPGAATPGPRLMEARPGPDTPWETTRLQGVVIAKKAAVIEVKPELPKLVLQPQISLLSPNRWYPGKSYEVTVLGDLFASGMSVDLGADVSVVNLQVANPTRATMTVVVAAKASPGPRSLRFRLSGDDGWRETGASGLVKAVFAVSTPPMVVQPPLADIDFAKGTIELVKPEHGEYKMMENMWGDHGTPKVTDSTRFEWQEKDVAAQWFELRILNAAGSVLMTRKISGQPMPDRFYVPDAQFITEIFDFARNPQPAASAAPQTQEPKAHSSTAGALQSSSGVSSSVVKSDTPAVSAAATSQASGGIARQLADGFGQDFLFWEVAGYKKVTTQHNPPATQSQGNQTSGGFQMATSPLANQPVSVTQDVEVAISERWPIKLPAFSPTGLACSMANTQLTADAVGSAGKIFYVGDKIQVSGLINIEECPWALVYDTNWGQYSGGGGGTLVGSTPVNSWTIRNMFIDWGDGTYDVVTAIPNGEVTLTGEFASGSQHPPTGSLNIKQQHTYRYSNEFPIRLFVLPAEDVGTIGSIVRMSKAPEPQPSQALRTPHMHGQALMADSGAVLSDAIGPAGISGAGASAAASTLTAAPADKKALGQFNPPGGRAFLLYCEPKILDIKADPAAIGPLHLENLAIVEFSGQKTAQSSPAQKPDGAIQSPTQPSGPIQSTDQNKPATTKPVQTGQAQLGSNIAVQDGNTATGQMTGTSIAGQISGATLDAAKASTCDAAFFATAELTYYGSGKIKLVWKVDGTVIHEQGGIKLGPSPERSELKDDDTYAQDILRASAVFTSPSLPLDKPAYHKVTVEAVLEEGEKKYAVRAKEGSGGMPIPEFYSTQADQVVSEPKAYLVSAPKPGEPCIFRFPVAGGKEFLITGLQGRATEVNGRWSGTGTLLFDLPDGTSGQGVRYVEIGFQGFEVDDDGLVTSGTIDAANLSQPYGDLPGVSATLKSLKGSVKEDLKAVFDVKVKDNSIRKVEGGTDPPVWTGVQAPLIPESGWYAAGQKLTKTHIGHSYFQIESDDVRLDLSRTQGSNPAGYSGIKIAQLQMQGATDAPQLGVMASGADWVGVHLGEGAVLYPYLFMLTQASVTAKNWYLTDTGITGHSRFNDFSYVFGAGSIKFDAIDIKAGNNGLVAEYINMRIEMPWPAMTLQGGSMKLDYTQKDAGADVEFNFADQESTDDYGSVRMHTKVRKFTRETTGWGMSTDTTFTFRDEGGTEVSTTVSDLFFNMYGVAYFNGGETSHNAGLNAQTKLGNVQVQLQALEATSHVDDLKPERLDFTLKGNIDFPGLSQAPVDIVYKIRKPLGQSYAATNPKHSKFTTGISFPVGRPMAETAIAPEIKTGGGGFAAGAGTLYASLDPVLLADASGGGGVQDTFGGTVETRMFGMDTPVKATFRYGTVAGDGYWLTHANVGGLNAPIFPGVALQSVNGGLAYGFSKDVFSPSGNPLSAAPNNPGVMVYSAGIGVSSTDPLVFEMAGQITVLPEDAVYRMEFSGVKLLTYKVNGGAFFEYASNSFSGKIWGGMSMFGGAVSLTAPKGADDDRGTVGLYFGPDDWEIYYGRQTSPIQVHFLIANVDGYMQLGKKMGARLGGGLKVGSGKICLGFAAAEAYLNAMVGVGVSPSAHLSADFRAGAGVSAWVPSCDGAKFSVSKSVNFHVEAMPLHLRAGFDIDCGWFGDYSINVTLI